jgi:adenylate kinase family enzyme
MIIGAAGSGKSALSKSIAQACGLRYINVDSIQFVASGGNWELHTPAEKKERIIRAMQEAEDCGWVLDGFPSQNKELFKVKENQVDLIIHLNYTYPTVLRRLLYRSFWRVTTRERLWGTDNRETAVNVLSLHDPDVSVLAMQATHFQRRRKSGLQAKLELQPRIFLDFRRPQDTDDWLAALQQTIALREAAAA